MYILITALLLFATALSLVALRVMRPDFRFGWLIAAGGAFLTWLSVILWQMFIPVTLELPAWQPADLFKQTPIFFADQFSWPYAFSLVSLALTLILTAVVREDFPDPLSWAGFLTLTGLGMLAVLADNPLTLVLAWSAIDLTEIISQIRSVEGERANERVVTAFATRLAGTSLLLWAGLISLSQGRFLDFSTAPPEVGTILILAAALRLGVIPLHLSFASDSSLRRGFGTTLRLVSAASSLTLLSRVPVETALSTFAPILLLLAAIAGIYGGLQWTRATDSLSGRPYWVIGMSALAIASALRGNPTGTVAWGVGLILAGGTLFTFSMPHRILSRVLLIAGVWGVSSLPFSPSASGWQSTTTTWATWVTWPAFLLAQALLINGFIRHILRPVISAPPESQPEWSRNVYQTGIGLLLLTLVALGLFGWDGARVIGTPVAGALAVAFTALVYWLTPRIPWLNPVGTRSTRPEGKTSPLESLYNSFWNLYQQLGRRSASLAATLEGDGGILWALLFLVLFLSLLGTGGSQP